MIKIAYTLLDFSGEVKDLSSQWDCQLIKDLLDGKLWQPAQGFEFFKSIDPDTKNYSAVIGKQSIGGCVVIIPARQNAGHEAEIREWLKKLKWSVVILVGDEERTFDITYLDLPKTKVWLMQPKPEDVADFYIGSGYSPHLKAFVKDTWNEYMTKPLDWSFMGQNNHMRRQLCVTELERLQPREDWKSELIATEGFTQGVDKKTYVQKLAGSKAAPAPSGIASPDSFRLYEALEAGTVPIADEYAALWEETGYWQKIFAGEDIPFKVLNDYDNMEGYINDIIREYPAYQNRVFAWWQGYKRKMAYTLQQHIKEFVGEPKREFQARDKITIIILTSPIKSHPTTAIIDRTIADMRAVLPDCEIIIGIDGVRAEQEEYRERYEGYKKALLWKCNNEWSNIVPVVFEEHMHQAAMTRQLLKMVQTETILFVEHDTALAPDFEYDWEKFVKAIETGSAYTIRFHFEAQIPEEHKPMMIGNVEDICGLPLLKTSQWSQRPHLSSTVFYRDMMDRYFTDESRTMIEDKVHGYPAEAYISDGILGWYNWRLWIYHPTPHIKRSYTSDGRGDDPKYEMRF